VFDDDCVIHYAGADDVTSDAGDAWRWREG